MSNYHRAAARARERKADMSTGDINSGSGIMADVYAQKNSRVQAAKRKEGRQSITDNGRPTIRNTNGDPINAPNIRTEKILNKKRKK